MLSLILSLALIAPTLQRTDAGEVAVLDNGRLATATAAPTAPPAKSKAGKPRVLVLDFRAEGVDMATARTMTEIAANAFAKSQRHIVISGADLRAAFDIEASKQALACSDDSCLAELAEALGAELVVLGSVGKLGDLLIVTMSLYDAARQTAAKTKIEDTNLAALSPKLDAAASELLGVPTDTWLVPGAVAAGAGAVVAGAGAIAAAIAFSVQEDPGSTGAQKADAILAYPIGLASLGVGVAALVAGGVVIGLAVTE